MITKSIKQKMKEYFLVNPTSKLRVRQIEKELKVPLPSAIRYTKELEKEKILKTILTGGIRLFTADKSSSAYILEKKQFNIKSLHDAGLVDYLVKEYDNPAIILFGSYAKGEDIETSDIDLYIETSHINIEIPEKIESKLKRKIQLFVHKNINEIKNEQLINNILNGIVINGFVEVFK